MLLFVLELCFLKDELIEKYLNYFWFCFFSPLRLSLINLILFSQHRSIFTQGRRWWFLVSWLSLSAIINWWIIQASVVLYCFNMREVYCSHFKILLFQYVYLTSFFTSTAYVWINHIGFLTFSFELTVHHQTIYFYHAKESTTTERSLFYFIFYFHKNSQQASWIMSWRGFQSDRMLDCCPPGDW